MSTPDEAAGPGPDWESLRRMIAGEGVPVSFTFGGEMDPAAMAQMVPMLIPMLVGSLKLFGHEAMKTLMDELVRQDVLEVQIRDDLRTAYLVPVADL